MGRSAAMLIKSALVVFLVFMVFATPPAIAQELSKLIMMD